MVLANGPCDMSENHMSTSHVNIDQKSIPIMASMANNKWISQPSNNWNTVDL